MQAIKPEQTMVLVTHKPTLLAMVNRLIVISGHQILVDGPRDVVIAKLQEVIKRQQETAQTLNGGEKS
jgi:ATP-binding cassette subfamily C protein LapB